MKLTFSSNMCLLFPSLIKFKSDEEKRKFKPR